MEKNRIEELEIMKKEVESLLSKISVAERFSISNRKREYHSACDSKKYYLEKIKKLDKAREEKIIAGRKREDPIWLLVLSALLIESIFDLISPQKELVYGTIITASIVLYSILDRIDKASNNILINSFQIQFDNYKQKAGFLSRRHLAYDKDYEEKEYDTYNEERKLIGDLYFTSTDLEILRSIRKYVN